MEKIHNDFIQKLSEKFQAKVIKHYKKYLDLIMEADIELLEYFGQEYYKLNIERISEHNIVTTQPKLRKL